MNERITQLAEQAGFENGHQDRYGNSLSQELEQFAELIVNECMSLVSEPGLDMNDTERGILAQIKEHFGVEE